MPEEKTIKRARADKRAGKASSTQAGEFIKEQVDKVRAGKHGVRSAKQAVAIGLSEARRAGVAVKSPKKGATSEATRKKAVKDNAAGQHKTTARKSATKSGTSGTASTASTESTARRSRAATSALKREGKAGASHTALSKQTKSAAAKRPAASRSAAAKKAATTKGESGRSAAAKKAAQTRAARAHR
ncbi:DUF6496 domain-containing protein [Paraburkholderia sp. BCC1886]|uniref:DUF6496 domain-containing protein n=1 Tax=Paraburkholderia sp. BCC1886 TaxID=2562670 RepID=UPI0011839974|nr:DUF6496 domain-containing protein [Paraburkholderia sp. BCC1886]